MSLPSCHFAAKPILSHGHEELFMLQQQKHWWLLVVAFHSVRALIPAQAFHSVCSVLVVQWMPAVMCSRASICRTCPVFIAV